YRSTGPILDASNAVIALARERFPKELWPVRPGGARPRLLTCGDELEQSIEVCRNVLEHREQGTELRRQAVLVRSGHHSDLLDLGVRTATSTAAAIPAASSVESDSGARSAGAFAGSFAAGRGSAEAFASSAEVGGGSAHAAGRAGDAAAGGAGASAWSAAPGA